MNGPDMSGAGFLDMGKSGAGVGGATPNASHLTGAQHHAARSQTKAKAKKVQVTIRRLDSQFVQTLKGRPAQTLLELHHRGEKGATSGEMSPLEWSRRTSAYVSDLRNMGFEIETRYEPAGDAIVGRYILHTPIEVVWEGERVI
jgi:hypothetical protein